MMRVNESRRRILRSGYIGAVLLLLFALPCVAQAEPSNKTDFDITMENILLRPDVSVNVHLKVYVNEPHPCNGKVIFALHGLAHTAATWAPFTEEIFKENPTGRKVCQLVAVDLPSRGGTTLPMNTNPDPKLPPALFFGDLTLEDHVTVLHTVLNRLSAMGIRPDTLLGHSQGGLLIQMIQQALMNTGTNLRAAFNIKNVVLFAPVPPREVPWDFADSGDGSRALAPFVVLDDPVLGDYVSVPDLVWLVLFFRNSDGQFATGTPMLDDVARYHYNALEPYVAGLELLFPFARPSVGQGIFSLESGTLLQIVSYEKDTFLKVDQTKLLYEYLTGDTTNAGFVEVMGPDAVHDTHVSGPRMLLDAIAGTIELP